MARELTDRERTAVTKIAGLTLVNALVFQEVLAASNSSVKTLRKSMTASDLATELSEHWQFIQTDIDYVPIFNVARQLLLELPADPDIDAGLRYLAERALEIVGKRAALRHDLMGRVYHRLLADAKFLGTYYTSVPAATLLLKLALSPGLWPDRRWSEIEDVAEFTIADLACGTGTLLMAAAEAVTDAYVRDCLAAGEKPNVTELHRHLMEDVIHGYDVLPSALHLTASTLALRASAVAFDKTNLYSVPMTGTVGRVRLGSIEFLRNRSIPIVQDLFGNASAGGQVTGGGDIEQVATLPDLDLCVMNPPFTRSVGGNLLFGSIVNKHERRRMQDDLSALLRTTHALASSTAGLGSVFVAAGDTAIKEGGRIALVLPKSVLSGVAWKKTRELLRKKYRLEYVIASHEPDHWNFSDNTELSEVLLVAQKVGEGKAQQGEGRVHCLNLWRNPHTAVEALHIAQVFGRVSPPDVYSGQGAEEIHRGGVKLGEALSIEWKALRDKPWMLPAAFAQGELIRTAAHLLDGKLHLPGHGEVGEVALKPLGEMGELGPDRRDIHDGFSLATGETAYAALWGHDAFESTTLARTPNQFLSPLSAARPNRPLRRVDLLWPRAGRIVLGERLWLHTQSVVAVRMDRKVLANVWWPLALNDPNEDAEKALVLWLNSTLGLLILLSQREETRGAWIAFKKPVLAATPVLDIEHLTEEQRQKLSAAYDLLAEEGLRPFREMRDDPVRKSIDEALADALGLPDFSVLRELLGQEPVVCLEPLD